MTRSGRRSSGSGRQRLEVRRLRGALILALTALLLHAAAPVLSQQEEDIGRIIDKYRGLLAIANQKLEDLDLSEALAPFTEVIDGYKTGQLPLATPLTRQIIGQAFEGRARTYANLGRNAEAEADYEALIRFDTAWPIDRTRTSPKIVAIYDKVRARMVGKLAIQSEPPGAAVSINGEQVGRTPVFDKELAAGTYTVTIEAPGFTAVTETLSLEGGGRVDRSVRLMPSARSILVTTSPPGSRVAVDGQPRGVTFGAAGAEHEARAAEHGLTVADLSAPLLVEHLKPGNHLLRIEKECYEPQILSVTVTLDAADPSPLKFELVRLTPSLGAMNVESTPPGADVTLDGEPAGKTPLRKEGVCSGRHLVRIRHAEAGQWVGAVDIARGQRATVKERLRMTLAYVGMPEGGPNDQPPAGEEALGNALAKLTTMNVLRPGTELPNEWRARGRVPVSGVPPATFLLGVAGATGADLVAVARPAEGGFQQRVEVTLYAARHPSVPPDRMLVSLDDSAQVSKAIGELDASTALTRAWLGIQVAEVHRAVNPVVIRVEPGSPAFKAGVKLGESVVSLGGKGIATPADLAGVMASMREGAQASLTIQAPGAAPRQVNVALGATPVMSVVDNPDVLYARLVAEMSFRARQEAALGRTGSGDRTAALLNLASAFMHAGQHDLAVKEALDRLSLPSGAGISAGTVNYLRGICMKAMKNLPEARRQLEAASKELDATLWSNDGPPVAERAKRLMVGL